MNATESNTSNNTSSSVVVPYLSIGAGMQRKARFGLNTWSKLVLTLDGRDKFTKILQYLSRFLAWYLSSQRFATLKNSLTTSRKAFRMGRSAIEIDKIRCLGLLEWIAYYLRDNSGDNDVTTRSLQQWINKVLFTIYNPIITSISTYPSNKRPDAPLWKLVGTAGKMIGLLGFWAGDNVSFLAQSGLFDNYNDPDNRVKNRKKIVSKASIAANRSYFVGSVIGLLTNWKAYWEHRNGKLRQLLLEQQRRQVMVTKTNTNKDSNNDDKNDVVNIDLTESIRKEQEKQFTLFVALLKSCVDVLVFSNNPGVDIWIKYRGYKMHEGFHCLCGLLSASTVLYNNYPNKIN